MFLVSIASRIITLTLHPVFKESIVVFTLLPYSSSIYICVLSGTLTTTSPINLPEYLTESNLTLFNDLLTKLTFPIYIIPPILVYT